MKITELQTTYEPGTRDQNGTFQINAQTPRGPYTLNQELPQHGQSEDGLEYKETLNGQEIDDDEGPNFDPPPHDGPGANRFHHQIETIVRQTLETWLNNQE